MTRPIAGRDDPHPLLPSRGSALRALLFTATSKAILSAQHPGFLANHDRAARGNGLALTREAALASAAQFGRDTRAHEAIHAAPAVRPEDARDLGTLLVARETFVAQALKDELAARER